MSPPAVLSVQICTEHAGNLQNPENGKFHIITLKNYISCRSIPLPMCPGDRRSAGPTLLCVAAWQKNCCYPYRVIAGVESRLYNAAAYQGNLVGYYLNLPAASPPGTGIPGPADTGGEIEN
jgi:hypothetical protein